MKPLIRKAAVKRWEGEGKVLNWRDIIPQKIGKYRDIVAS